MSENTQTKGKSFRLAYHDSSDPHTNIRSRRGRHGYKQQKAYEQLAIFSIICFDNYQEL